jgi:hypothetical protein
VVQKVREKIEKWDYMKLKSYCTAGKQSPDWRESPENQKISLPDKHLTRDLKTIMHRELQK